MFTGKNNLVCFRIKDQITTIYPADVVLFEGILVFYFPKIRDLFHMKLFVDTDSDTRLARRGNFFINQRLHNYFSICFVTARERTGCVGSRNVYYHFKTHLKRAFSIFFRINVGKFHPVNNEIFHPLGSESERKVDSEMCSNDECEKIVSSQRHKRARSRFGLRAESVHEFREACIRGVLLTNEKVC